MSKTLVLRESDLQTITNALYNMAAQCFEDAEAVAKDHGDMAAERFKQSAKEYHELANVIDDAEKITVEI